jgi:hypothetical protein
MINVDRASIEMRYVQRQRPFPDPQGRLRRIGFVIEEPPNVKIAIEVDGYDKTGRGGGMTRAEFNDWSRREVAMTAAGWRVLRFAVGFVKANSSECVRAIELTLQDERSRSSVQELRSGISGSEKRELEQILSQHRAKFERLEGLVRRVEAAAKEASSGKAERGIAEKSTRSRRRPLWVLLGAVVLAAGPLAVLIAGKGSSTDCPEAIGWSKADEYVGEFATVQGSIVDTGFDDLSGRVFLDMGERWPSPSRFTVVIDPEVLGLFEMDPRVKYEVAQVVCVTGTISEWEDITQIKIDDPSGLFTP